MTAPIPPKYKQTNHVLHLVVSILTVGFWIPVWVTVAAMNSVYNREATERYQQELITYSHATHPYRQD